MTRLSRTLVMFTASFLLLVSLSYADTVTPGTTIDQQNWQIAEHVLPPEILRLIQAGDFAITVQETTDFPVRQPYLAATEANTSQVALDGGTRITGYTGGRPFPVMDIADPRAGEKAAWNWRYRDMPKALEMRVTMQSVNDNGAVTMQNLGKMQGRYGQPCKGVNVHIFNGLCRVFRENAPEPPERPMNVGHRWSRKS